MTNKQYSVCVAESANYDDLDAYVSDMMSSSVWGDIENSAGPAKRPEELRSIYTAATRTVREIVAVAGMTQAAVTDRLCIPRRTLQDWCRGVRECPLYTRLMMQQCLGIFAPPTP